MSLTDKIRPWKEDVLSLNNMSLSSSCLFLLLQPSKEADGPRLVLQCLPSGGTRAISNEKHPSSPPYLTSALQMPLPRPVSPNSPRPAPPPRLTPLPTALPRKDLRRARETLSSFWTSSRTGPRARGRLARWKGVWRRGQRSEGSAFHRFLGHLGLSSQVVR
jgi:hypothetical protein